MGEATRKRRLIVSGDAKGTYADKLTLDESASNDIEMVKDAIKNAKKYSFGNDKRKAQIFVKTCLDITLKRLGIKVEPPTSREAQIKYAQWLDKAMADRQVRIEHRSKYRGNDMWRRGIYVYQRDELVAFISDILTHRRTEFDPLTMKVGRESVGLVVITNARTEDTKRIFLMSHSEIDPIPAFPFTGKKVH